MSMFNLYPPTAEAKATIRAATYDGICEATTAAISLSLREDVIANLEVTAEQRDEAGGFLWALTSAEPHREDLEVLRVVLVPGTTPAVMRSTFRGVRNGKHWAVCLKVGAA